MSEPFATGYLLTLDNSEGVTVAQTDVMTSQVTTADVINILDHQAGTDMDFTATSASQVAIVYNTSTGEIIYSQEVLYVWHTD